MAKLPCWNFLRKHPRWRICDEDTLDILNIPGLLTKLSQAMRICNNTIVKWKKKSLHQLCQVSLQWKEESYGADRISSTIGWTDGRYEQYEPTILKWNVYTLKKCANDLRDNSLLERPAVSMVSNLWWKFMVPKYGTYSQHHIKCVCVCVPGTTSKCSVCCLFTTWLSYVHV